jgi:hypothetical protein
MGFSSTGARVTRVRLRFGAVAILVIALAGALFAGVAAAATSVKPYSVVITPSSVAGGSSTTFTVAITNGSANQSLGSANVTAPAGITVTGASPSGVATVVGNVVELRNLAIAPGGSRSVSIQATAPCGGGSSAWQVVAKQSNSFNGPPGNEFVLDTSASSLGLTVVGSCHLNFFTQPADAVKGTAITTTPINTPQGGAIAVEVLDGNNQRMTSSAAAITVAIGSGSPNPAPGATLSGTTTQNAIAGVASFSNLAIDLHGDYTLSATSPGVIGASSGSFAIWDQASSCASGTTCSVSVSQAKNMSSQITSNTSTTGVLVASLGAGSLTCGDTFNHAPIATTFNAFGLTANGAKTATVQIDKVIVQATPNNGVSSYRVCYESPTPFTDRAGNSGVTLGLLPDCSAVSNQAPCVQSITKTKAGDVLETLSLPAGDPRFR